MAFLKVKNNARSRLASQISAEATSLTVASGEGARFPTGNFHISIEDEILLCTQRTNDTLTVQRGREGTTPAPHGAGAEVQLRWTAAYVEELQDAVGRLEEKAGVIDCTLAKAYLSTAQGELYSGVPGANNPRVELDTIVFNYGNCFQVGNWYGEEGNYLQADSSSDATHIRDADANFPPGIRCARVRWASNAQGTQNTGEGYVASRDSSSQLTVAKVSGADFGPGYYYWIRKAQYVVPFDGVYAFMFQLQYPTVRDGKRYGIYIFVNGVQVIASLFHAGSAQMMRIVHNGVLLLNEGDIVTMHGYIGDDTQLGLSYGAGEGNTCMTAWCIKKT